MNPPASVPRPARPSPAGRQRIALTLGLALGLVLITGPGCSRSQSDVTQAHDSLRASLPGEWQTCIQVTVGPALLGLARAGLSFTDAEPEARTALRAVRGLKVSMHQRIGRAPARATLLQEADRAMKSRGWNRVVGVIDGDELVAVYAPADDPPPTRLPLCVLVFDGQELVLVSARSNLEPLVSLALEKSREHGRGAGPLASAFRL